MALGGLLCTHMIWVSRVSGVMFTLIELPKRQENIGKATKTLAKYQEQLKTTKKHRTSATNKLKAAYLRV